MAGGFGGDGGAANPRHIHDIPYRIIRPLCMILDTSGGWKQLAAEIGYGQDEVNYFGLAIHRGTDGSPSQELLNAWSIKHPTITRLIKILHKLEMVRPMEMLKELVSAHWYNQLVTGSESGGVGEQPLIRSRPVQSLRQPEQVEAPGLDTSELPGPGMGGPYVNCERTTPQLPPGAVQTPCYPQPVKKVQQSAISKPHALQAHGISLKKPPTDSGILPHQGKQVYPLTHPGASQPKAAMQNTYRQQDPVQDGTTSTWQVPQHPHLPQSVREKPQEQVLQHMQHFSYQEIKRNTFGFHKDQLLGQGGFGMVYKVRLNCTDFAVKKLKPRKTDPGPERQRKLFLQEISALVSKVHPNIIQLSGYSADGPDICLVYQYMDNGSLEDRLACRGGTLPLSWLCRLHILTGAAHGVQFLHSVGEKPLIHGDIKSANILLDKHLEPKIADFGLAMEATGGCSQDGKKTHISRENLNESIYGSKAYLPAEFFSSYQFSIKTDTYSFGIVIFETCTGEKAFDGKREGGNYLKEYVDNIYETGNSMKITQIRDPAAADWPNTMWLTMMNLGRRCTAQRKKDRPEMPKVWHHLDDLEKVLQDRRGLSSSPEPQSVRMSFQSQGQGYSLRDPNRMSAPKEANTGDGQAVIKDCSIQALGQNGCQYMPALDSQTTCLIQDAGRKLGSEQSTPGIEQSPVEDVPVHRNTVTNPGHLSVEQMLMLKISDSYWDSTEVKSSIRSELGTSIDETVEPGPESGSWNQHSDDTEKLVRTGWTKTAMAAADWQLKGDADDPRWLEYDPTKLGEEASTQNKELVLGVDMPMPLPYQLQIAFDQRKMASMVAQHEVQTQGEQSILKADSMKEMAGKPKRLADVTSGGCGHSANSAVISVQMDENKVQGSFTEVHDLAAVDVGGEDDSQCLTESMELFVKKSYPTFMNFDSADSEDLERSDLVSYRSEDLYGATTHVGPYQPSIVQSSSCHGEGTQCSLSGEHGHLPHPDASSSLSSEKAAAKTKESQSRCDSSETKQSPPTQTHSSPPIYQQALGFDQNTVNVNSCPFPCQVTLESSASDNQGILQSEPQMSVLSAEKQQQLEQMRQRAKHLIKKP